MDIDQWLRLNDLKTPEKRMLLRQQFRMFLLLTWMRRKKIMMRALYLIVVGTVSGSFWILENIFIPAWDYLVFYTYQLAAWAGRIIKGWQEGDNV